MTTRAACANSAWLTSTTWATIDATSFNNSESANTALTTAYQESTGSTTGVITIDAILVKIASRAASPTGTMTVHLAIATVEVPGTAVTVNVSDLPTCTATSGTTTPVGTAEGGWFCFKLAAPVTLVGATLYTVGAKTSSANQVNLWSSAAANWSRALRTTTTGNMAAGDDAIIVGEWTAAATVTARTVTMDETAATDYGGNTTSQVTPALAIGKSGTLTYGTTASTAYNLRQSGYVIVYNGGTLSIGSSGSEIPRNSTAVLQFDCAADGDFGLVARLGATVNMYGLSRTAAKIVSQTLLNADAAAAATSITIVADTGWLSGDLVCLAPTSQTSTQFESKALTGNATATTAAITGLTNAHSGTSPTQAEVGLLTRNVQFTSVTANVVTFFYIGTTATVNCSWTDFRYISTNATGKRGIEITTITGSTTIDYCAIRDCDSCWIYMTGATLNNVTITNTVMYNFGVSNSGSNGGLNIATATSGTWTISNNMMCGAATTNFSVVILSDVGGTFTNNSISGNPASGAALVLNEASSVQLGTFSGLSIHSNGTTGISTASWGTISSSKMWRMGAQGVNLTGVIFAPLTFTSCDFFGNATAGIISSSNYNNVALNSCTFNGDTTFAQASGVSVSGNWVLQMNSCLFSVVAGIKTKNTVDLNYTVVTTSVVISDNCIFNGTSIYPTAISNLPVGMVFLQAENFGQTANDNHSYIANGTTTPGVIQTSTGTFRTAAPSIQFTPTSAVVKLGKESPFYVACNSGATATFSIYVNVNGSYNGAAPRLILPRQDSMGILADTVCATWSGSTGTWVKLTYTTGVAPQNGVYAFYVDGDGTAGSWFCDDAAPS